jgi:hypothetical protein
MNDKLERIWKETVIIVVLSLHLPGEAEKNQNYLSHRNQCPGQYSTSAAPEYKLTA